MLGTLWLLISPDPSETPVAGWLYVLLDCESDCKKLLAAHRKQSWTKQGVAEGRNRLLKVKSISIKKDHRFKDGLTYNCIN